MIVKKTKIAIVMEPIYRIMDFGFYKIMQPDYEIAKALRESRKHVQSTKLEKKND